MSTQIDNLQSHDMTDDVTDHAHDGVTLNRSPHRNKFLEPHNNQPFTISDFHALVCMQLIKYRQIFVDNKIL